MAQPKLTFPEDIQAAEEQIVEQSKRIEFYITEFSIELLAMKMEQGDFYIPDYQREFTWEEERKSRFIESVVMGLPVPFLFFWETEEGLLEVVDGSQRLRTLHEFIYRGFVLGGLDGLGRMSGFRFEDLLESRQRKIKNRSIRGIVLNEHADEQARFDMFDRINTGSKAANPTEIRRGALSGPFLDLVIGLAREAVFIELAPIPEKGALERGHDELVTRFFAYGDGLDSYKDKPSQFLFEYTREMNLRFEEEPSLGDEYRDRFLSTMSFISENFPYGFKRSIRGYSTPRVRFEAIAIGSYYALQERPELASDAMSVPPVDQWIDSDEFKAVIGSDGANAIARLRGRIDFVRERLLG